MPFPQTAGRHRVACVRCAGESDESGALTQAMRASGVASIIIMVLLWLCDVPYRHERVPNQPGAKRLRLTLPQTDFVTRRLEDAGVHIEWAGRVRVADRDHRLLVRGLLHIAPGSEWRGVMTRWDEEATTMHAYYKHPADAYSVKVRRVFELLAARPVNHMVDPSGHVRVARVQSPICRPFGLAHAATASEAGFCVTAVSGGAGVERRSRLLGDAVREWGFSPDDLDKALMVVVTTPIVDLVMALRWSTLILRVAWSFQPFQGFLGREWAAGHAAAAPAQAAGDGPQLEDSSAEVTCTRVDTLMDNLRRWAPVILAAAAAEGCGDEDAANEENMTL